MPARGAEFERAMKQTVKRPVELMAMQLGVAG
jgi:hypothetical protein